MYLHCPLADGARNVARQFIAFVKSRWRRELQAKQGRVGVFSFATLRSKLWSDDILDFIRVDFVIHSLCRNSPHVFESNGGERQEFSVCLFEADKLGESEC